MDRLRLLGSILVCTAMLAAMAQPGRGQVQGDRDGRHGGKFRYEVLHSFQGQPDSQGNFDPLLVEGLVADGRGTIFGGSLFGGSVSCVTVANICLLQVTDGAEFKLDDAGNFTLFANPSVPGAPANDSLGPLLLDRSGNVLFAAEAGGRPSNNGMGGVFSLNPRTGIISNPFSFAGEPIDGATPGINVIQDAAGNLFGTTIRGGQNPTLVCKLDGAGCGTVYKLDAHTRQETVLHTFMFSDGWQPVGLALDPAGNLIGAASLGDSGACRVGFVVLGCGAIFRIDPSGNFSFVHEFDHTSRCPFILCPPPPPTSGPPPELLGWNPQFVAVDEEGNILGVTGAGGSFGLGVIFKIDTRGNYSVLHHFAGPGDGFVTVQILVRGHELYGINQEGGDTLDCDFGQNGCGTIFRVDTHSGEFEVLHTFSKDDEGTTPTALAFDQNGDLIGSNLFGGNGVFDSTVCTGGGGCGNVFRLTLKGGGGNDE